MSVYGCWKRAACGMATMFVLSLASDIRADEPLHVVATFSILGDMTTQVGGDRINLVTLVGPNEDAHVFQPQPSHARALAEADLVIVNGLGFEGWIDRLVSASGYKGTIVAVSDGVVPLGATTNEDHDEHAHDEADDHDHHEGHDDHAHGHDDHGHEHGDLDPHAWQDLANARIYIENITAALIAADPEGRTAYEDNAARYVAQLDALEAEVRLALAEVPDSRRTVVTNHEAFGYLGRAYGITFLAPEVLSTDDEPSASELAALIRQIRDERVTGVFIENIADNRIAEQIVAETDARIGGTLYSDALSGPDGPAPTYLDMMRHNVISLTTTMQMF